MKKGNFFTTLTDDEARLLLSSNLIIEGELLERFWRMEEFNGQRPKRLDLNKCILINVDDAKRIEREGFKCLHCGENIGRSRTKARKDFCFKCEKNGETWP
jgi:hypothetical protein